MPKLETSRGWSVVALVSRKTVLLLLAALVLLSIALRYPLVEHERFQTDSYTIHLFAKSIVDFGYAKWTFNILSYLGYYPISYPSGSPFLLAGISELTGASMETSILLSNMLLSVVFCLGAFLLARQFIRRPEYALLATFFAVTGARFVDTTYWNASARGLMVVLVTLVLFLAFRAALAGQTRLLVLGILLGIGSLFVHHMSVLLALFGVGYVLAAFQSRYLLKRFHGVKRGVAIAWNSVIAISIAFVAFTMFGYFSNLASSLQKTSLFDLQPPALSILLNMGVSYTNQIGFIIVLAFLGLPSLFRKESLSTEALFPLTVALAFIPILGNTLYVSMLLAPLISILGVLYLSRIRGSTFIKRSLVIVLVLVLMVSAVFLPLWSSARWNESGDYLSGQPVEVDPRIYSDATYLKEQYPNTYGISNVDTFWAQLGAFSDTRFLTSNVFMAINGDVTASDLRGNVSWSSAPFPDNLYNWYTYTKAPNPELYVLLLTVHGYGLVSSKPLETGYGRYFMDHQRLVVAIDNSLPSSYSGTYDLLAALLPAQLRAAPSTYSQPGPGDYSYLASYMIYQSGRSTMYIVDLNL